MMDVDVDLGGLLGWLRLVGLLIRLQSSQVTEDFAETVVRNLEFFLAVLQLLFLAEEPVDAVPHANATTVLDIASDAFSVGRDVLKGAAHIAHAPVDPFGLFRVGLEDVMDFAHREKASHFLKIGAYAADDAHIDGIGWADITHTFGLGKEFGKLVGTGEGAGSGTEGKEL